MVLCSSLYVTLQVLLLRPIFDHWDCPPSRCICWHGLSRSKEFDLSLLPFLFQFECQVWPCALPAVYRAIQRILLHGLAVPWEHDDDIDPNFWCPIFCQLHMAHRSSNRSLVMKSRLVSQHGCSDYHESSNLQHVNSMMVVGNGCHHPTLQLLHVGVRCQMQRFPSSTILLSENATSPSYYLTMFACFDSHLYFSEIK